MSRAYDAKQAALKAYPNSDQADDAIDLFAGYIGGDWSDIEYDLGMTMFEYLYGEKRVDKPKDI